MYGLEAGKEVALATSFRSLFNVCPFQFQVADWVHDDILHIRLLQVHMLVEVKRYDRHFIHQDFLRFHQHLKTLRLIGLRLRVSNQLIVFFIGPACTVG